MRLVLYTGKGGVGKTTTAAATAAAAAARGLRTLIVSADAAHSLGDVFDRPLDGTPRVLARDLEACEIDAQQVIESHWGRVRSYLVDLLRYQGIDEVIAEELALLPGADELSTLVRVEEAAAQGTYDLIVVDCAPTGSTLRLVTLPEVARSGFRWLLRFQRAAAHVAAPIGRGLVGVPLPRADVFAEAERLFFETLGTLRTRLVSRETTARLVTTPESMAIDEARRTQTDLALFEIGVDAVVLNRMLPEAALAEPFFESFGPAQRARRDEVRDAFAPLPILEAPLGEDEVRGVDALAEHGRAIFGERDPASRLGAGSGLRFAREGGGGVLEVPMGGRDAASLDVARVDDEIVIDVAGRRRRIPLPVGFANLDVERVALQSDTLVVRFGRDDRRGPGSPGVAPPPANGGAG